MFSVTIRERNGQVYTFHFDKPEVLIGRVKGNDVILPKQNISKRHASVRTLGNRFVVEDMGSTNGTYVNGHRIAEAVEVGADDKVYLGDFVMQFFAIEEEAPALAGGGADDLLDDAFGDLPIRRPPAVDADEMPALPDMDDAAPPIPDSAPQPHASTQSLASQPAGPRAGAAEDDGAGDGGAEGMDGPTLAGPGMAELARSVRDKLAKTGPDLHMPDFDDPFADVDRDAMGAGAADFAMDRRNSGVDFVSDEDGSGGVSVVFDAGDESTVAQLEDVAAAARAEIEAALGSAGTGGKRPSGKVAGAAKAAAAEGADGGRTMATAPFAAVASTDPASDFAAIDDRLTGRVDGLSGALDAMSGPTAPTLASLPSQHGGPAPLLDLLPSGAAQERGEGYHDALARLFGRARQELRSLIGGDIHALSDAEWSEIERRCFELVDGARHGGDIDGSHDVDALRRDLVYELTWLGPLESLLDDDGIERVEVDAYDRIAVVRAGRREESPARFSCQAALASAVERVVLAAGASVREGRAHAEGALADGTTVRVVWPPLAPAGPLVVLRKPHRGVATLDALAARGWMSEQVAVTLSDAIAAGRNVAVVGPTGEARRAVVEALASAISNDERIAVIEREAPLCLEQTHVLRLDAAARDAGVTGPLGLAAHLGADRVVIAGCDTRLLAEVVDLGCEGGFGALASWTANDAADGLRRAAHAVLLTTPGVDRQLAEERVALALDVVAEVTQAGGAEGSVEVVVEVVAAADGGVELRQLGA